MTNEADDNYLKLEYAVDRGVAALSRRQLPTGQFPAEVTFHDREGSPSQPDEALFPTAHIVYSLGFLPHAAAKEMISRAMDYFAVEMDGPGLWRHWNKSAQIAGRQAGVGRAIPADLDDIASVSYLFQRHGVGFPDNRDLIVLNRNRDGRFFTWLVPRPTPTLNPHYWRTVLSDLSIGRCAFFRYTPASYGDVDGVVNANVLLYLGERKETQDVISWLKQVVDEGREAECDSWYHDGYTFSYALSRCYLAGVRTLGSVIPQIVARIQSNAQADGQIGDNALHTALAVNTLLNFDEHSAVVRNAVEYLVRVQQADGAWESAPYYYGAPTKAWSWGSQELTTGICLEALYRYCGSAPLHAKPFGDHTHLLVNSVAASAVAV